MLDRDAVTAMVQALADRVWDVPAIEARYRSLLARGIPRRPADPATLLGRRAEVLDAIQRRAEEYEYLTHS